MIRPIAIVLLLTTLVAAGAAADGTGTAGSPFASMAQAQQGALNDEVTVSLTEFARLAIEHHADADCLGEVDVDEVSHAVSEVGRRSPRGHFHVPPWAMSVDSRATTGAPSRIAWATSGWMRRMYGFMRHPGM